MVRLLLETRWSPPDHRALRFGYSQQNPGGLDKLLLALHQTFPSLPSRARLMLFMQQHSELLKGFRWKRLAGILSKRRLVQTCMQPVVEPVSEFGLPDLPSVGYLAEHLLHLPGHVLEWLQSSEVAHYVVRSLPKRGSPNRLPRILEQPKRLLKAVQRDIQRELLAWVPVHDAAHGFVKRRSVQSYTCDHVGQSVVLRMDLENFFPSITAPRVSALFRTLGYPNSVINVLTNLCTCTSLVQSIPEWSELTLDQQVQMRSLYVRPHLPQGAPTSPTLANLVAWRLDARLSGLARTVGCHYTRYADDLLFSGDRYWGRHANRFQLQVGAIALDEGFNVNYRKTRIMPQSTRQSAASVVLNCHTNSDRKLYDNLKATLTNCVRYGLESQNRENHTNFRAHLLGRIGWVRQLNQARSDKLLKIYRRISRP